MRIHVLFFAGLSESLGERSIQIEIPDGSTAGDALDALNAKFSQSDTEKKSPLELSDDFRKSIALAVNHAYVREDAPLADGDELALIPPVSGG